MAFDEDLLQYAITDVLTEGADGVHEMLGRLSLCLTQLARRRKRLLLRRAREEAKGLLHRNQSPNALWADDGTETIHWGVEGLRIWDDYPACGLACFADDFRPVDLAINCPVCRQLLEAAGIHPEGSSADVR